MKILPNTWESLRARAASHATRTAHESMEHRRWLKRRVNEYWDALQCQHMQRFSGGASPGSNGEEWAEQRSEPRSC